MYHVLVADKMSEDGLKPLLGHANIRCIQQKVDEVESLTPFDALLVRSATTVTSELMDDMPNLKIIARAGVGVDNIDIAAATQRGIVVVNAPDGNTISTAEHTFAMISSLLRNIPQATQSLKSNEWKRSAFLGTELYGKTLGIVGLGRIGSEIASRAKAFRMNVCVFDPFLTKSRAEKLGIDAVELNELLKKSDIITVHTPLTKETRGLLNFDNIPTTKKGVFLINCARGGIIDEEALYHYVETGHVAGAALDVFEEEPPENSKLLKLNNVIATPHIAASTKEAQLNVAVQVSEEVISYLEGRPVKNSINLPTLSKEVYQKLEPYYELTRVMGQLLSQCMKSPVQSVEISYSGGITDLDTSVTTKSLLAGFLRSRVDATVNEVNAAVITKERGITYSEKYATDTNGYSNLIEAKVEGEHSDFYIQGTYIQGYGFRIVNLNGFVIDFYPHGHLIYIQHTDRPGVIGKVGKILGEHDINIATMQVGRKEAGGEAIMMLSFDAPVNEEIIKGLQSIEDIVSILTIDL